MFTMSVDSPFAHRLRRNYVARPDEEPGIKDAIERELTLIREIGLEVEDVERAIAALATRKKGLLERKEMHQRSVRDHKALLCGILHLPADILSEIFMDLVPASGEWSLGAQMHPHPIVRISHVCHQWRNVALSNPMLWTTLHVRELPLCRGTSTYKVDLEQFQRKMALVTEMASVFISRAAASPMTLTIHERDPTSPSVMPTYAESVLPLANLLREARWAKTQLCLTISHPESPLLLLLDVVSRSGETLREADIALIFNGTTIAHNVVGRLNLENMEQLSVLHLDLPEMSPLDARIRWDGLTELILFTDLASVHAAIGILVECPNLIRFDVSTPISLSPSRSPYLPRSITHPLLHKLTVFGDTKQLVETLVLPALGSLQILDTLNNIHHPSDIPLLLWTHNYGSQLTHLAFNYEGLDLSTLLRCFEDLPEVISLDIAPYPVPSRVRPVGQQSSRLHRSVLQSLTVKWDEPGRAICVCPKIQQLTLHEPDTKTNREDWVVLISSRRRGKAPGPVAYLKTAEIYFSDRGRPIFAMLATMRNAVRLGLAVRGISEDGISFRVEKQP